MVEESRPKAQLPAQRPLVHSELPRFSVDFGGRKCTNRGARGLEASTVETMAVPRAPDEHGGGCDHGGRSRRGSSDRRGVVGILRSIMLLVQLGGLLVQVYLLLNLTS